MLQDDLWIGRLATQAKVEYETSSTLWKCLVGQIEQRLASDYCIDLGYAGLWSLRLEPEYIANTPEGRYLIPPRLALAIEPPRGQVERLTLLELVDALHLASSVRIELIRSWLTAVSSTLELQIGAGRRVAWAGVGVFIPSGAGWSLEVAGSFAEALNKPFSMFAPVPLGSGQAAKGLEVRSLGSLAEATMPRPLHFDQHNPQPTAPHLEPCDDTSTPTECRPMALAEPLQADEPPAPIAPTSEVETSPTDDTSIPSSQPSEEPILEPAPVVESPPSKRGRRSALVVLLLVLLALGIAITLIYRSRLQTSTSVPAEPKALAPVDTLTLQPLGGLDSTRRFGTDSLPPLEAKPSPADTTPRPTAPTAQPAAQRDRVGRHATAEDIVLQPGDSLMRIAQSKYGHRAFWVYIYEENRELIPDPDNVPVGIRLRLPAASKYGIDPDNNNSVSRALVLQRSLITQSI